ncbi:MAG: helix-turn-helix domain-containing protein [Planctomycetota bacterium]|nr:helix-turn-helix domain-containing protein [Planctomycetota bacterium]
MASEFLTVEQVCERLGVTAEDVKAMVAEGRLSEVRDGGKVFFRSEEIERMSAKEGSSVVDLAMTDEPLIDAGQPDETDSFASALSSLADSSSGISVLDDSAAGVSPVSPVEDISPLATEPQAIELGDIPDQLPAAPKEDSTDELTSEIGLLPTDGVQGDTASLSSADSAVDLGLSGSDVIKLESADDVEKKAKEDTRITSAGISVFDDDEMDIDSDPMGKTHDAPAVEDFDAVGSGSGLLDLTRESDDTSLGQILDVISPTEVADTESEPALEDDVIVADVADSGMADVAAAEAAFETGMPGATTRRAVSAMAGSVPLNICMVLGLFGMLLVGLVTSAQIQGVWPATIIDPISGGTVYIAVFVSLILLSIVTGVMAILAGRGK